MTVDTNLVEHNVGVCVLPCFRLTLVSLSEASCV